MSVEFIRGFLEGLKPEPILKCSEWADRHRRLSNVASAEPGPWRTNRTPYLRELMDSLSSDSPVQEIVFMKGAQIGATEAANNAVGYWIDNAPGSILMVMPTDDTVKRNSTLRIDPMIQATPKLRDKVAEKRSRDASNTTKQKEFPGGVLILTGANSATGLRSTPVRYLVLDEVDGYPPDLDGEGSPVELAKKRTATYSKRKIFMLSTPTIHGTSIIEQEFESTDQRYYFVPCPICGTAQVLKFKNLKWQKGKPATARYQCEHCSELIEERHKTSMLEAGFWQATQPDRSSPFRIGYHLSALYSPLGWYSWKDAAKDWEDAQDKPLKLKTFVNTVLGECYVEKGTAPDWEKLYNRREGYGFNTPPKEVCFVTAGADVQKDRIEVQVVGWGKGRRSWVIDYRILDGDTSQPDVWNSLAAMVGETWTRSDGMVLPMLMMAVDSGFNTQHAYDFCRRFDASRVVPVKGQDRQAIMLQPPKPVDVTINGQKVGNVRLWNIGVSLIKSELYGWLRLFKGEDGQEPEGYVHFPEMGEHYFRGITAEKLVLTRNKKGYSVYEWKKEYDRNEPLDTFVYARAAAAIIGIDRMTDQEFELIVTAAQGKQPQTPKKRRESDFW